MNAKAELFPYGDFAAPGDSPAGDEQFKLARLLELRAVVDSLRVERGIELMADVQKSMERPLP